LVAVIPLGPQTPWPVGLRVGVSVPGLTRVEQHLCLEQKALGPETRLDFAAGPGPELALVEAENLSAAAA
jgi:hypothetical protein